MISGSNKAAVLFADIAKSTQLYEILGDRHAQVLIEACLTQLSQETAHYGGQVIKTIGDAVLAVFPTTPQAINAAISMQQNIQSVTTENLPRDWQPPNLHIGIHFGPVIYKADDIFGDAVNIASRMADIANQRQILFTKETLQTLAEKHPYFARKIDKTSLKGKEGTYTIYEIIWEEDEMTIMFDSGAAKTASNKKLELFWADQTIMVDQHRPAVTLGRLKHNDIIITQNCVSRSHARIEFHKGQFKLIDHSSNGTYLEFKAGEKVHIRQHEAFLVDQGCFGLGNQVGQDAQTVVRFTIHS
jgi:adenylate cyclase